MADEIEFERALESCLQELSRTGDVEGVLDRHPQFSDRLRPLLTVAQTTHRYYADVPPAPGGLVAGRERLLVVAAERRQSGLGVGLAQAEKRTTGDSRNVFAFSTKLLAVLMIISLGTAALGGGIVWAASDSLPGDLLYPVKLLTEDLRLALSSGPAAQVDLTMQFLQERVRETGALAEDDREVSSKVVDRLERHIERALKWAAQAPDEETVGLLEHIQTRTRLQIGRLEQIQVGALRPAQSGLQRALTACQRGADAAQQGLEDPAAFRARYQNRAPEQEPAGEQNQERQQNRNTPVTTPHVTPQGPQETSGPQLTPKEPRATPEPKSTPKGSQGTTGPKGPHTGQENTPTHEPSATAADDSEPPRMTPTMAEPTATLLPTTPVGDSTGPRSTPRGPEVTPGQPNAPPQSPGSRSGGGH
jgi:hypothetical protein